MINKIIGGKLCLFRPPSNADILGSQLLGYRVYIRDMRCSEGGAGMGRESCQDTQKKTISDPTVTHARIGLLSKFVQFRKDL